MNARTPFSPDSEFDAFIKALASSVHEHSSMRQVEDDLRGRRC